MNIRRLVAAALALLMLLSFVGCKTVDKTTDKKLPSSSGSSNEAISEEQSENTEQESSATPSDSSDNSASASEGGSTAKETQNQSGGTATTAQLKPDIKKSRNFLAPILTDGTTGRLPERAIMKVQIISRSGQRNLILTTTL